MSCIIQTTFQRTCSLRYGLWKASIKEAIVEIGEKQSFVNRRSWTVVIEPPLLNSRFRTVLPVLQNRLFADVSNLQSFQSKDEGNPPWRSGFCRRHFREEFLKKTIFLTLQVHCRYFDKGYLNYFFALYINDICYGMVFAENKFV